jgi:dockerin type I repeat protein
MSDADRNPNIPPTLRQALQRAYAADPPEVELNLDDADRGELSVAGYRRDRRWSMRGLAMAAVLLLGVTASLIFIKQTKPDPMDLNRDGFVDVLDAMVLSISIEQNTGGRDLTGDGSIDRADVAAVINAIVLLDGDSG